MKKYFYIVAAAVISFYGCSSDDSILDNDSNAIETIFTASIESEGATRVSLVGNTPNWEVNDEISIDGHSYLAASVGTTTTFSGSGATETTHHAYFPASIYNGGNPTLPSEINYDEGKFNMPMYAESTTDNLEFKNICTILAVSVSSEDIDQVKAIKVASTSKALSGAFTVSADGVISMESPDDNTKTVTLTCATAIPMSSTEKIFYIAIPPQIYEDLKVYLSSDGTTFSQCMATKKPTGLGLIARNKIYNINYEKNAVQLWTDGPYFATVNIGSSISDFSSVISSDINEQYSLANVGGLYQWGGTNQFRVQAPFPTTDKVNPSSISGELPSANDVATSVWGSCWHMTTRTDFEGLVAGLGLTIPGNETHIGTNTIWSWCDGTTVKYNNISTLKGWKVAGKSETSYEDVSIFLPVAGYHDGYAIQYVNNSGDYWSSTPNNNTSSWCLSISKSGISVGPFDGLSQAYSIRAVLK